MSRRTHFCRSWVASADLVELSLVFNGDIIRVKVLIVLKLRLIFFELILMLIGRILMISK